MTTSWTASNSRNTANITSGTIGGAPVATLLGGIDPRNPFYGAKVDGQAVYDAVIALVSGTTYSVSSATANFSANDVSKVFGSIAKSSGQQYGYHGTVSQFVSTGQIYITCANSGVVSSASIFVWGTDDSAALNAAITAAAASVPQSPVIIPLGIMTLAPAAPITFPNGVTPVGIQNTTVIDPIANMSYGGSCMVLCSYLGGSPFVELGTVANPHYVGSNIRNVTVDAMGQAASAVYDNQVEAEHTLCTFLHGTGTTLNTNQGAVVEQCRITGTDQQATLSMTGDCRVQNNYVHGAGANYPCIVMSGTDMTLVNNHMWRDSDTNPLGDGILLNLNDGGNVDGAITIGGANKFDSINGSPVNITITNNTTVRVINIVANHAFANDATQNYPSAVCSTANIAIANSSSQIAVAAISSGLVQGSNGTATSNSSGTIYIGQVVSGTNIPANTRIIAQVSGTPGGAGTYTMSANATGTSSGTYNFIGNPFVILNIAAGSTLRMLRISDNTGMGSLSTATKSPWANLVDGTNVKGTLLAMDVSGNDFDDMGAGYGSSGTGTSLLASTTPSGRNVLIVNSASTAPVAF